MIGCRYCESTTCSDCGRHGTRIVTPAVVYPRLGTDDMVALRDAARVPIQQAIELISEGVTKEHFAVTSLLVGRFRQTLTYLLQARDELK